MLKTEEELRIEAMDDEMRDRKRIEEKLRAIQIKARKQKESQHKKNVNTQEVQRLLTSIRGLKEGENIFEQMIERGQPITFSDNGIPLL